MNIKIVKIVKIQNFVINQQAIFEKFQIQESVLLF